MPLRIGGKYSYHSKISTNSSSFEDYENDDIVDDMKNESDYSIMHIGQENLKLFTPKVFSDSIDKLYSKNFSKISSLILKKYYLHQDGSGITINEKSSRKKCTFYNMKDIAYMVRVTNHEKAIGIVLRYGKSKGALHAYLCANIEDTEKILKEFQASIEEQVKVEDIQANFDCIGYELIHNPSKLKTVQVMDNGNTGLDNRETDINKNDFGDFESIDNFRSANTSSPIVKEISKSIKENIAASFSPKLNKNKYAALHGDDLDDDFTDLAKKRNPYNPEHLQDKTVESTLLVQESEYFMQDVNSDDKNNTRPRFFSSYSKLSDGNNLINL